jgi:hypothetical protein
MPRNRWPNVDLDHTAELQEELDQVATWAASLWHERAGGRSVRGFHDVTSDVSIRVSLDLEKPYLEPGCRDLDRGNAATPGWCAFRNKLSWTPISGSSKRAPQPRPQPQMTQTFVVPDCVLVESPVLLGMRRDVEETGDPDSRKFEVKLGPVHRRVQLFPAVVTLMKLRWLARLHHGLVAYVASAAAFCAICGGCWQPPSRCRC